MQMLQTKATAGLEHKYVKFAPVEMDAKTGIFAGYASTFGNEDQGNDIVQKGAFTETLADRDPRQVKMLYEHSCLDPIGYWNVLREDDRGLYVSGKLMVEDLQKAREVHALLRERVLDGLSIGYRVTQADNDRGNPHTRLLKSVDLKEISVVMFPMNEEAVISSVKADLPTTELVRIFEKLCTQDAAKLGLQITRSEVRQHLLPAYKSLLKAKQDAGRDEVASKQPDVVDWSALQAGLRRLHDEATRS